MSRYALAAVGDGNVEVIKLGMLRLRYPQVIM